MILGVSHKTVLTFMSEIGPEGLKKFSSAKSFQHGLDLHQIIIIVEEELYKIESLEEVIYLKLLAGTLHIL